MELINTLMSRPDLHLEREFTGNWARSASELLLYAESSHISSAHTSTRCLPSEDNMRQGQNKGQACPDPIFYLVGIFWLMMVQQLLCLRQVEQMIHGQFTVAVWALHHQVSQLFTNTPARLRGVSSGVGKNMCARVRCDGFHLFKDAINWLAWTSKGQSLWKSKIRAFLSSFSGKRWELNQAADFLFRVFF